MLLTNILPGINRGKAYWIAQTGVFLFMLVLIVGAQWLIDRKLNR